MPAEHRILVLHGPNLNLLGTREPDHYGTASLEDINQRLIQLVEDLSGAGMRADDPTGIIVECRQSNAEHELVSWVQQARQSDVAFIVINPAAFTHTSVALRDALSAVEIPFIEVHLSNVHAREPFRHHSYLSDLAVGVIAGLGAAGYEYALREAIARITRPA